jgi:hypothetical protein
MCNLEAQPKFNCKIVITLLLLYLSHWALFIIKVIIINISQLHNQIYFALLPRNTQ